MTLATLTYTIYSYELMPDSTYFEAEIIIEKLKSYALPD
jgi:hypothetical protein